MDSDLSNNEMETKYNILRHSISNLRRAVIAYSGGVDSTFLLKVCVDVLGVENVIAFIASSPKYPEAEVQEAQRIAGLIGSSYVVQDTTEMEDQNFISNTKERCYYCKIHLFESVRDFAGDKGIKHVLEGSNRDDLDDFRPGRRACAEQNVKSPLLEAGLTKAEIRYLSKKLSLLTHDKPSYACLSSRVPYGTPISIEILKKIEVSEQFIKEIVKAQVRVRHHGNIARIEVEEKDLPKIIEFGGEISDELIKLGFTYVCLDLKGYRTGSMNESIT